MQDEGSLESSSLKTFQSKCQVDAFVRMKFETNLVC